MQSDSTPPLSVRGVSHRFDGRQVLDDVDVDVPAGRVVGLLGPNGAGKTTLMRIVFGVLEPDAGTVAWQGRIATDADRRRWGYMPQERGLYREMRTLDHLVWLARLYGIGRADARTRATDLLERLGLADRMRDPIRELSGGMAQRVQLAAAMVRILLIRRAACSMKCSSSSATMNCDSKQPSTLTIADKIAIGGAFGGKSSR